MNQPLPVLRAPPIIEAVVDIDCDFGPRQNLALLESPARECFSRDYPKFRPLFQQELRLELSAYSPLKPSARQGLQSFQFLKDDERQLVQVRATGFSFNRLAPYTSFDDYRPEIQRTWGLYREIAGPIQVKTVRLRYINRIPLPVKDNAAQIEEYFRLGPRPVEEDSLRFVSFLNQYVAIDTDTGHQVTTLLTTQRSEESGIPVIFDNAAAAVNLSIDPSDWIQLDETLRSLRVLKNRVFRNTLQDKCLNLFQ